MWYAVVLIGFVLVLAGGLLKYHAARAVAATLPKNYSYHQYNDALARSPYRRKQRIGEALMLAGVVACLGVARLVRG
jgi:hypothetical protein